MGRDKMKSASVHSFHDEHTEPLPPASAPGARTPFESLVREILDQLGEDPSREGLRQTPARVETSLKWLTRGYHMSVADVIGDALYSERHENLVCVRDIEIYSLCEHHLLPFFGRAHVAYLPNGRLIGLSKIRRPGTNSCGWYTAGARGERRVPHRPRREARARHRGVARDRARRRGAPVCRGRAR